MTIYSYRTRRLNWKYRQILAESKEMKINKIKRGQLVPISSLLNLNIRIADIVIIQWVRSESKNTQKSQ
ncbi:hypothetical protein L1987_88081 [Smallanthus sonchifolius]|nr:hypothetical protein L1987_88081 [Smallanthus sonchifolius]